MTTEYENLKEDIERTSVRINRVRRLGAVGEYKQPGGDVVPDHGFKLAEDWREK